VHLLHTYSNTPQLRADLESVSWTVRRAHLQDEPTLPSTERVWRFRDRLNEAEMDAVVASYYSGASVTQLARQYGINHWSVNKLVRERGHREDVPSSVELRWRPSDH
jgi:transposase-like protein